MTTNQALSASYAYYYPEGAGYLHIRTLGSGTQGVVELVLSCADKKLYVRKRDKITKREPTTTWAGYGCDEVNMYRVSPLIPRLIDWTVYRPVQRSEPSYYQFVSTSTIAELFNMGDVQRLLWHYRNLNDKVNPRFTSNWPAPFHIPEAIIWKAFGQLVQAANLIHRAQPRILHGDIFVGNAFVRSCAGQRMVNFCLADFGKARTLAMEQDEDPMFNPSTFREGLVRDYESILTVVKQMMIVAPIGAIPASGATDLAITVDTAFDIFQQAITGTRNDGYDADVFQNSAIFPEPKDLPDRATFRRQLPGGKKYSLLLFDTIRQFEKRLRMLIYDNCTDQSFYPVNVGVFETIDRWDYLGKAIEARAMSRMGDPDQVDYPAMDDVWDAALQALSADLDQRALEKTILHSKDDILAADALHTPIGPFRIAEVNPQNWQVTSISSETYNTFSWHSVRIASPVWLGDNARRDSDHSIPHDPTQNDQINIVSRLDFGNLW